MAEAIKTALVHRTFLLKGKSNAQFFSEIWRDIFSSMYLALGVWFYYYSLLAILFLNLFVDHSQGFFVTSVLGALKRSFYSWLHMKHACIFIIQAANWCVEFRGD